MPQLQAGYVLEGLLPSIFKLIGKEETEGLLAALAYFEIEERESLSSHGEVDPVLAVVHNMICRGLPTRPSIFLEETFSQVISYTKAETNKMGSLSFPSKELDEERIRLLGRALHIIDPRLSTESMYSIYKKNFESLGSDFEEEFLFHIIPEFIGEYATQLIESQRDIETILKYAKSPEEKIHKFLKEEFISECRQFSQQRVDFSIELPYLKKGFGGMVVEIDGRQHLNPEQQSLDIRRNEALHAAHWNWTRIPTHAFPSINQFRKQLLDFFNLDFFKTLKYNYLHPLFDDEAGLEALQLMLSPIGIARVQRVLLQYMLSGALSLTADRWTIGILEEDVPCGALAVKDLQQIFQRIFYLEGKGRALPEIELKVTYREEFSESLLHSITDFPLLFESELDSTWEPDLWLEISVLRRAGFETFSPPVKPKYAARIRSAHGKRSVRSFKTGKAIRYRPIGDPVVSVESFIPDKVVEESLTGFLQDLFRKEGFREGQLPILNRALKGESVIGLLPTGGGKSLTYQLATLLQPGITLVIDPIKSLMKDQYDNLIKSRIDGCIYINSSLVGRERETAHEWFRNGQALFAFVSPERLQIPSFREILDDMGHNEVFFSFCVIDEAHCVSEWGHDFRTAYLRLGENVRRFCQTASKSEVPLFGLTATASFDVLADVQRELNLGENAVVRPETLERKELTYNVIEVIPEQFSTTLSDIEAKKLVANKKRALLLKTAKQQYNYKKPKSYPYSLIFCPHRTWLFGVKDTAILITNELKGVRVGTFMGTPDDGDENLRQEAAKRSEENQEKFINDELEIMVATKAFGMGIDKPNIRQTIHFNMPSSVESFVQEAGRAGRDRDSAVCTILFNKNRYGKNESIESVNTNGREVFTEERINTSVDREILRSFLANSFKGRKKEKALIAELMTEIRFPVRNPSNVIARLVEEEFGERIILKPFPQANPHTIYVNAPPFPRNFGGIILETGSFNFNKITEGRAKSEEVLSFVNDHISNLCPSDLDPFAWLKTETLLPPQPGIEHLLKEMKPGETREMVVHFENDTFKRMEQQLMVENSKIDWLHLLYKSSKYCHTPTAFLDNLNRNFWQSTHENLELSEKSQSYLSRMFPRIRTEADTYKAVYRLSILGIVKDYLVNYNAKTLTLTIAKKTDEEYVNELIAYVEKYRSREKARNVKILIQDYWVAENKNEFKTIYQCLSFLIDFVYSEIAKKRAEAINVMERACVIGLQENGGEQIADFIELYFTSRYANPQNDPNLVKDSEELTTFSMDLVRKYIREVAEKRDNWKHLRGACTRLLVDRPGNYVLLLLNAYASLLLETTQNQFSSQAFNMMLTGFLAWMDEEKPGEEEIHEIYQYFVNQLFSQNQKLKDFIPLGPSFLFIGQYNKTLKRFNDQFLRGYENRHSSRTGQLSS